ncbi:MAG: glucokinase [Candidatus Liberibacter ctenarytainae]|uniref:Glucokinase n=1 Tax=Candidatus Liberibacter ctenarytainae TaxID=2020335 RepID=A0A937DM33_9HYPH|nr:glucokinase [Candidatus Liberibacter ctenarytainae]
MSDRNFPISFPLLLADIGGTNVRFAILRGMEYEPEFCCAVKTADYDSLEHAIQDAVMSKISIRLRSAFLAIAASISGQDTITLTNYKWVIRPEILISEMCFEDVLLINDFEAQALAISSLSNTDYVSIGPHIESNSRSSFSRLIVGPGTGLGVAGLMRMKNSWIPISGEGGHINIGPSSERDFEIFPHLTERAEGRFSAETLLSGRGLINIYKAICTANGVEGKEISCAEDVVSLAADPTAFEAINLFCEYLGRIAGDLSLIFMSRGGVYVSGGIPCSIIDFLRHSNFRNAFENKAPHTEFMRTIPTYVIMNPCIAIVGMVSYIKMADNFNLLIDDEIKRRWF